MCTHRVPSLLMPSPRTRNSENAVCKKRIMPSMSRTQRFACSSRTVSAHLQGGLKALYATPHGSPYRATQEYHSHGRTTSYTFAPGAYLTVFSAIRKRCRAPTRQLARNRRVTRNPAAASLRDSGVRMLGCLGCLTSRPGTAFGAGLRTPQRK